MKLSTKKENGRIEMLLNLINGNRKQIVQIELIKFVSIEWILMYEVYEASVIFLL